MAHILLKCEKQHPESRYGVDDDAFYLHKVYKFVFQEKCNCEVCKYKTEMLIDLFTSNENIENYIIGGVQDGATYNVALISLHENIVVNLIRSDYAR